MSQCPHSTRPDAGACSQCLGAAVRVVTQEGGIVFVDGVPVRTVDAGDSERSNYYSRRGGNAHHAGRVKS